MALALFIEPVYRVARGHSDLYFFTNLQWVDCRVAHGAADNQWVITQPGMYQLLGAQYLDHFYIDLQSGPVQSEVFRSNPKNNLLIFDFIGNSVLLNAQGREILKL